MVVIGATNRVDALDGALRRPGRRAGCLACLLACLVARVPVVVVGCACVCGRVCGRGKQWVVLASCVVSDIPRPNVTLHPPHPNPHAQV